MGMDICHSPESGTPGAPLRPKSSTPRSGFVQPIRCTILLNRIGVQVIQPVRRPHPKVPLPIPQQAEDKRCSQVRCLNGMNLAVLHIVEPGISADPDVGFPILANRPNSPRCQPLGFAITNDGSRSEEHTSELQ